MSSANLSTCNRLSSLCLQLLSKRSCFWAEVPTTICYWLNYYGYWYGYYIIIVVDHSNIKCTGMCWKEFLKFWKCEKTKKHSKSFENAKRPSSGSQDGILLCSIKTDSPVSLCWRSLYHSKPTFPAYLPLPLSKFLLPLQSRVLDPNLMGPGAVFRFRNCFCRIRIPNLN